MINRLVKIIVSFTALVAPVISFAAFNHNRVIDHRSAQIEIDQQVNVMTSGERFMLLNSLVKKLVKETPVESQDALRKHFNSELLDLSTKMGSDPAPGKACE